MPSVCLVDEIHVISICHYIDIRHVFSYAIHQQGEQIWTRWTSLNTSYGNINLVRFRLATLNKCSPVAEKVIIDSAQVLRYPEFTLLL